MANLFKNNLIKEKLKDFQIPNMEEKIQILEKWYNLEKNKQLENKKEEELEGIFGDDFFGKILGYNSLTENEIYNRKFQPKAPEGGQKADLGLGFFGEDKNIMKVVIELKDAKTSLDKPQQRAGNLTPVQQAFKYKPYFKECDFVILSNFTEIRLYIDNYYDFEVWTLKDLINPNDDYFEFKKFYYLLSKENLINENNISNTKGLLSFIRTNEKEITKKFYSEYSILRKDLFKDIIKNNSFKKSELDLALNKTQKIIDRIIFIHFCEDLGLLPDGKLKENIFKAEEIGFSSWEVLKVFFRGVDKGSEKLGIPDGYNGGLFHEDEFLNKLVVGDEICKKFVDLGDYDFKDDLSVNILGHIFEQSISDIEEMKERIKSTTPNPKGEEKNNQSQLDTETPPQSPSLEGEVGRNSLQFEGEVGVSKRKKDGIFYTPEYIVDYIVKNSVGKKIDEWEEELKQKHNLKEDITDRNYTKRAISVYTELQEKLQNIKVLDPACGSGAFLVKVFDFLLDKNKEISKKLEDLGVNQGLFSGESYFKTILQNNIYGVDLNEESVEITKLSLWLKTASKGKKLANLDNNIKCGNSLIDDESVAGSKAFVWEKEFGEIFEKPFEQGGNSEQGNEQGKNSEQGNEQGKNSEQGNEQGVTTPCSENREKVSLSCSSKNRKAFHITWVTHNSRISERMIKYKVEKGEGVYLDDNQEIEITGYIRDTVKEDNLKVLAYNICKDHIHILLVCDEEKLPNIIRKLKGKATQKYKESLGIDKTEKFNLWAQKYNNSFIDSDEKFNEVVKYINNNREKHELPVNNGLQPIVKDMLCSYEEAFSLDEFSEQGISTSLEQGVATPCSHRGGFDVIVGNPPYIEIQKLNQEDILFLRENYNTAKSKNIDIYIAFYEKGIKILKENGILSFITPNRFLNSEYGELLLKYLSNYNIIKILNFRHYLVFEDADVYTVILSVQKTIQKNEVEYLEVKGIYKTNNDEVNLFINNLENQKIISPEFKKEKVWNLMSNLEKNILNKSYENNLLSFYTEEVFVGLQTSYDDFYILKFIKDIDSKNYLFYSKYLDENIELEKGLFLEVVSNPNIKNYSIESENNYILFPYEDGKLLDFNFIKNNFPKVGEYFEKAKINLENREKGKMKTEKWYGYVYPKNLEKQDYKKLLIPHITKSMRCAFDENGDYAIKNVGVNGIVLKDEFKEFYKYILCLLNCKLLSFILSKISIFLAGGFYASNKQFAEKLPIPNIPPLEQKPFIEKADFMLNKNKELQEKLNSSLEFLKQKFNLEKINTKLEKFYLLDFVEFKKAIGLNKGGQPLVHNTDMSLVQGKKKISMLEEEDLMNWFNSKKSDLSKLKSEIDDCDREIDNMVFDLYGLDEEERMVVLGVV